MAELGPQPFLPATCGLSPGGQRRVVLCAQGGLGSVLGPRLERDRGLAALTAEGDRGGLGRSLRDGRLRAFGGLCPGHLLSGGAEREDWLHIVALESCFGLVQDQFSILRGELREDSFPFQ